MPSDKLNAVEKGQSALDTLAEQKLDAFNHVEVQLTCAADIEPEAITWLWNGWLAAGKLHILGGAPGTAKTMIALSFAATVSKGARWPDGTRSYKGNVVIWSGEDGAADTLIPRLIAAGADRTKVYLVQGVCEKGEKRPFDPAKDFDTLRAHIGRIGNVRLLIVDPIVSVVQGDSHKNTEVRRSLQPLADFAASESCAVLGITHFTKGTKGNEPLERITGSLAFGALARVAFVAAEKQECKDGTGSHIFMRAKSNIGPNGGGFHYRPQETVLEDYPDVLAFAVMWGEAIKGNARDALAKADAVGREISKLDEAKYFLLEELAHGPRPVKELETAAKAADIGWRTIETAKTKLNVKSIKRFAEWRWQLPEPLGDDSASSPQKSIQERNDDLTEKLGGLAPLAKPCPNTRDTTVQGTNTARPLVKGVESHSRDDDPGEVL